MMCRIALLLFFLCGLGTTSLFAQLINGRLTTSIYGWERIDSAGGPSTKHLRGYENVQLDVGNNTISFHTYLQGATDFANQLDDDPHLRLFNAYLDWRNVGDMIDIRLGRQSVFAGVNYGSFDGTMLKIRPADGVQVMAYGGGLTPVTQKAEFFKELKNNWQLGGQVLMYLIPDSKISVSYMNRHRESKPVETFRPDAQMRLIPVIIDYGSRANQYASIDVLYSKQEWWAFGRCDYDFNFERLSRAEIAGHYQPFEKLGVSLNFAHREATISYNSYFALLESEANQEGVVGIDYELYKDLSFIGRFSGVNYEDQFAWRASVGALTKNASIMYTRDLSYDGSLDGFNVQAAYPFMNGKLSPHIGANYSHYALADGINKVSTLSAVIGAAVHPWQQISIDVQGQYMNNKIYKSDMRVFARVSYWFAQSLGITE